VIFECRARGIFRHDDGNSRSKLTPYVGDNVDITILDEEKLVAVIDAIHPRKNTLIRPPVVNVSQIAIVISTANPSPNFLLVDKLIASAERENVEILICVNKTDIKTSQEVVEIYETAGFPVISLCAANGQNFAALSEQLNGKITVLAGNSGVGKSSILNILMGETVMEVGEVSEKVQRGKHTTRHSELLLLPNNGYIIDTPGFSAFDSTEVEYEDVELYFREFEPYLGKCKFTGCSHINDKGCAILEAMDCGIISKGRHTSYVEMYTNAKKVKKWEKN